MFCDAKADFVARGNVSENSSKWLSILDLVTAGNFVWSMTTARYIIGTSDEYPKLRASHLEKRASGGIYDFNEPILLELNHDYNSDDSGIELNEHASETLTRSASGSPRHTHRKDKHQSPFIPSVSWTERYEKVRN